MSTDIMTMVRKAVLVPYYDSIEEGISFGEPFKREVTVRYNRSNWIDIDMQSIRPSNTEYVITSQFYIFII